MAGSTRSNEKSAHDLKPGDELPAPKDVLGDRHDDGLWPDFDLATESVRTQAAVDQGYARGGTVSRKGTDTKVTEKSASQG